MSAYFVNLASTAWHSFAQSAAPVAVTALWQGIAIAAALAVCLKLAPRISAAHRFAVWAAAFVALVALPFLPILARISSTGAAAISNSAAASPTAFIHLDLRWSLPIALLWLIASILRAADLLIHSLRLRKLWRSATPIDPTPIGTPAFRRVEICSTKYLDRPSVIGFFSPRILIPDWLFARLTEAELSHIVLHESEHLRRRDDWTNLLQKLALVVFPLNPALWFIDSRLSQEREMACDEGVVRITQAPRAYAACLASLAERGLARRTEALSLGAWHRRPELVHRVHGILRNQRAMHPAAARALLATLGSGLLMASFELARCPQLVAFLPAQQIVARTGTESAGLADAAYSSSRPANLPQFHAVRAVAKFPAVAQTTPIAARSTQHRRPALPSSTESLQVSALRSTAASPADHAHPAGQFIVLTTWEQVETVNPSTQLSADYDTSTPADATSTNQSGSSSGTSTTGKAQSTDRITVTRLIFKVLPANSNSTQPAAIPIGNGWFVIQL
jgi:beta-lactamase regulating signal transducer with metallopeptidase domain